MVNAVGNDGVAMISARGNYHDCCVGEQIRHDKEVFPLAMSKNGNRRDKEAFYSLPCQKYSAVRCSTREVPLRPCRNGKDVMRKEGPPCRGIYMVVKSVFN